MLLFHLLYCIKLNLSLLELGSYKPKLDYYNKKIHLIVWGYFTSPFFLSFTQKKGTQHKNILPCDFQIVLWACKILIFFSLFILDFLDIGFFCWKIWVYFTFLQAFFLHYIMHEHFTCIFIYHIFIFKRLNRFEFSQENATHMEKKNQINVCHTTLTMW